MRDDSPVLATVVHGSFSRFSLFVIVLCVLGMKNRNILKCSSLVLHEIGISFHIVLLLSPPSHNSRSPIQSFISHSTAFSIYNATNHFPSWACFMLIVCFRFCSKTFTIWRDAVVVAAFLSYFHFESLFSLNSHSSFAVSHWLCACVCVCLYMYATCESSLIYSQKYSSFQSKQVICICFLCVCECSMCAHTVSDAVEWFEHRSKVNCHFASTIQRLLVSLSM